MKSKTMILFPAALLGALPFAASAETLNAREVAAFRAAPVSLQQAADTALKTRQGALAEISFDDENGRFLYEAIVVGADGEPWTIMIDATNGNVVASGASSTMGDDDGEDGEDGERDHGRENGKG